MLPVGSDWSWSRSLLTCFHLIVVFWVHFGEKSAILVLGVPTDHVGENFDFFVSSCMEPKKLIQLGVYSPKIDNIFLYSLHDLFL